MSGLRDELAALANEWAGERYPATGDPGWNQGYDIRRETDIDALTALLDRFPPEAEGEAASGVCDLCGERGTERLLLQSGQSVCRWYPSCERRQAALAASPEEQDR